MVSGSAAYKLQELTQEEKDYTFLPEPLKYTSVSLRDVVKNRSRLEASAYNLDAKVAVNKVKSCEFGYVHLWGPDGLIKNAYHRPRFKRIFVAKKFGLPIFQPSAITEVKPKPEKFISDKTNVNIDALRVKKGMLLMTVSGTIGKCSIVSKTLDNQIFSHDLLRIIGKGLYDTGYIYAFLQTKTGQAILQSNNYGAVIQHIEPEHLTGVIIPKAPDDIKAEIHNLVIESYDLRDQSNDLIDEAEKMLYEELKLPPLEELQPNYFKTDRNLRNYTTKLSELDNRLDPSYHLPICRSIIDILLINSKEMKKIGDPLISKAIVHPDRFKRVYSDAINGAPFFGGKNLLELNPHGGKFLALEQHSDIIENDLRVKVNTIIVSRSGTVGKLALVPKHWDGWIASDDLIRIYPSAESVSGYIYCWLNSEYGKLLIRRNIYGSVIDHIEVIHLSNISIPILNNQTKQQEINNLVLKANQLRYEAHLKEQEAIKKVENAINTQRKDMLSIAAEEEGVYFKNLD